MFNSDNDTKVVHCKKESYDVYIGRGSKWGNPFKIGEHGNRNEVISYYKAHIMDNPTLLSQVHELKGKRLGCYCAPLSCHGDILKRLADNLGE